MKQNRASSSWLTMLQALRKDMLSRRSPTENITPTPKYQQTQLKGKTQCQITHFHKHFLPRYAHLQKMLQVHKSLPKDKLTAKAPLCWCGHKIFQNIALHRGKKNIQNIEPWWTRVAAFAGVVVFTTFLSSWISHATSDLIWCSKK